MFQHTITLMTFVIILSGCWSVENATAGTLEQTIYFGGDIITMEGDKPTYVEAVIERDGKIIYAGNKAGAVNNFAGKNHDAGFYRTPCASGVHRWIYSGQ